MPRPFLAVAVTLAMVAALPGDGSYDERVATASLRALQADDLRVAGVAFRLATHATALCARTEPLPGLLIQDLSQFDAPYRAAAATLFNLDRGPAVEGVVAGGPADRAGIVAGDVIAGMDGRTIAEIAGPASDRKSFDRAERVDDALAAGLARRPVMLDLLHDGRPLTVRLAGEIGCASRVQLVPGRRMNASADGRTITLSVAILSAVTTDDELAFLIGHEMSHNILGHHVRLEAEGVSYGLFAGFGGNAAKIRKTEEEADYLAIYVMASAAYDPLAAPQFLTRFERQHGPGIFADATHLNGSRRVRFLQSAADEVLGKMRSRAKLKPDFRTALARY